MALIFFMTLNLKVPLYYWTCDFRTTLNSFNLYKSIVVKLHSDYNEGLDSSVHINRQRYLILVNITRFLSKTLEEEETESGQKTFFNLCRQLLTS